MAASWAPNLLMLPSSGLGRYRASLVGSVTAKVLHDVTCPVWTSVHAEEAPVLEEITCRRVLCAVDLGLRSGEVLDLALYLAREYQGDVAITHVTRQMESPPMLANARARIAELLSAAGATAMILLRGVDGDPANAIACAAKEFHADVLVAGRHPGGDQELLAKRNIYDIVGKSP
jgi:nucleotide-binding universal stress UspA family protein